MSARPWKAVDDGIVLTVRLTPKGGRDRVDGLIALSDGRTALAARVRALPEKGAANAALEKLLAKTLGVGKTHVSVIAGMTARLKTVAVTGDPASLIAILEKRDAEA